MGVQISNILPKKEIEIKELSGKTLAVDAFLWLHQFLSIIRQPDGIPLKDSKGRITSHLSGLFYRSARLLENNIKLVWVFDGEKPDLKTMTIEQRKELREEAYKKWQQALSLGDLDEAKKAWLKASLRKNLSIPEPTIEEEFSGKLLLRIPAKLHMSLAIKAKKENLSLNQFIRKNLEANITLGSLEEKIEELSAKVNEIYEKISRFPRADVAEWETAYLGTAVLSTGSSEIHLLGGGAGSYGIYIQQQKQAALLIAAE